MSYYVQDRLVLRQESDPKTTIQADEFGHVTIQAAGISPGITVEQTGSGNLMTLSNAVSEAVVVRQSGRVGVGISEPTAKVHILQTGTADAFRIDDEANDTTPFLIDALGNVGIGTTSLTSKLTVNGDVSALALSITAMSVQGQMNADGPVMITDNSTTTALQVNEQYSGGRIVDFQSNGASTFYIDTQGFVGIGNETYTATQILQVGNGGRLRIANHDADYTVLGTTDVDGDTNTRIMLSGPTRPGYLGDLHYVTTGQGDHIWRVNNTTEVVRIDAMANVGIGTAAAISKLHVETQGPTTFTLRSNTNTDAATIDLLRGTTAANYGGDALADWRIQNSVLGNLVFSTLSTSNTSYAGAVLTLGATGRVGVNQLSPFYTADIRGVARVQGDVSTLPYPPAPLTADTTLFSTQVVTYGFGEYVASASSSAGTSFAPSKAFDHDAASAWRAAAQNYASNGAYSGAASTNGYSGEWVQLRTPRPILVSSFRLHFPSNPSSDDNVLQGFKLFASQDEVTWTEVFSTTAANLMQDTAATFSVLSPGAYQSYRLALNNITGSEGYATMGEWTLYGDVAEARLVVSDVVYTEQSVGVGVDAPRARVHIVQNQAVDSLRIDDVINDTTPFVINAEGNVGIGAANPPYKLFVGGDASLGNLYRSSVVTYVFPTSNTIYARIGYLRGFQEHTFNALLSGVTSTLQFRFQATTWTNFSNVSSVPIEITQNNTPNFQSPFVALYLLTQTTAGANEPAEVWIAIAGNAGTNITHSFSEQALSAHNYRSLGINLNAAGHEVQTSLPSTNTVLLQTIPLDQSENRGLKTLINTAVGIDTAVPSAKLHVVQSGTRDALRIDDEVGDTTPLIVTAVGNVGMGTSTPSLPLQIVNPTPLMQIGTAGLTGGGVIFGNPLHGVGRGMGLSTLTDANDVVVYTAGMGSVGFLTGSHMERMRVTDTGRVGIGTTQPLSMLHVWEPITVGTEAGYQSGNAAIIGLSVLNTGVQTNGVVGLQVGRSNTLRDSFFLSHVNTGPQANSNYLSIAANGMLSGLNVTANGNVGVNIVAPTARLHVSSPGGKKLQFDNDITTNRHIVLWESAQDEHQFFGFGINNDTLRYQIPATYTAHRFYAATSASSSTELLTITGGGFVGITNNNPGTNLHIRGNYPIIRIDNNTYIAGGGSSIEFANNTAGRSSIMGYLPGFNNVELRFQTFNGATQSNTSAMVITGTGYVGIGTMTPSTDLHVVTVDDVERPFPPWPFTNATTTMNGVSSTTTVTVYGAAYGNGIYTVTDSCTGSWLGPTNGSWAAFDNNPSTYHLSCGLFTGPDFTGSTNLVIQLPTAIRLSRYTLYEPANAETNPKAWIVEGSNDGVTYTLLDTRTGVTWTFSETKSFAVSTTRLYTYYRFTFTQTAGSTDLWLHDVRMYGYIQNILQSSRSSQVAYGTSFFASGAVGVGTTTTPHKFYVTNGFTPGAGQFASMYFSNPLGGYGGLTIDHAGTYGNATIMAASDDPLKVIGEAQTRFVVSRIGGMVGVHTASPSYPLHVEGNTLISGQLMMPKANVSKTFQFNVVVAANVTSWYKLASVPDSQGKASFTIEGTVNQSHDYHHLRVSTTINPTMTTIHSNIVHSTAYSDVGTSLFTYLDFVVVLESATAHLYMKVAPTAATTVSFDIACNSKNANSANRISFYPSTAYSLAFAGSMTNTVDTTLGTASPSQWVVSTHANTKFVRLMDSSGRVGINTGSPAYQLTTVGQIALFHDGPNSSAGTNSLSLFNAAGDRVLSLGATSAAAGGYGYITAQGGGEGRVLSLQANITQGVGIGTTTPSKKLQVSPTTHLGARSITNHDDSYRTLYITPPTATGISSEIQLEGSTANRSYIFHSDTEFSLGTLSTGGLNFATNGTKHLWIDAVGNVRIRNKTMSSFNKSLGGTVGNATEICTLTATHGAYFVDLTVVQSEFGNSITKSYRIPIRYDGTANSWKRLLSQHQTGLYVGNDWDVDILVNLQTTTLRLVRTGAVAGTVTASNLTCTVTTYDSAANGVTITNSTVTFTAAGNTGLYSQTPVQVIDGGLMGIQTATPAASLHIAHDLAVENGITTNYARFVGSDLRAGVVRKTFPWSSGNDNELNLTNAFTSAVPTAVAVVSRPSFVGAVSTGATAWLFVGYLYTSTAGVYTFGLNSDDASDMFVDGKLVADFYGMHGPNDTNPASTPGGNQRTLYLQVGYHRVLVRLQDGSGLYSLYTMWKKPGDTVFSEIPDAHWFYNPQELLTATTSGHTLLLNGNVGIGSTAPSSKLFISANGATKLRFENDITTNRHIVLWDGLNNEHQFYGLGVNGQALRFQIENTSAAFRFYAGTGATTSNEVATISGTGALTVTGNINTPGTLSSNTITITNSAKSHLFLTGSEPCIRSDWDSFELLLDSDNTVASEYFIIRRDSAVHGSGGTVMLSVDAAGNLVVPGFIRSNTFQIGTSTVIDASRNLTNIGTASMSGLVTITTTATKKLQFNNDVNTNRHIVLYEDANNEHQFFGIGINNAAMRFQLATTISSYRFYVATGASSSQEVFTISGSGAITAINNITTSGNFNTTAGGYQINGVPVIDASRNLNVSSITSAGGLGGTTITASVAHDTSGTGVYKVLGSTVIDAARGMTCTSLTSSGLGTFHNGLTGVPAVGVNGNSGTRLVLWTGTAGEPPYAFGIETSTLWTCVPSGAVISWYTGTTERMRLTGVGNLGIGTTSPSERLVVSGNAYITGNMSSTAAYIYGWATISTQGLWLSWNRDGGSGMSYYINQRGGGSGGHVWGESTTANVVTETMRLTGIGYLGIGTNNPGEKLHVVGNIYNSGFTSSSGGFVTVAANGLRIEQANYSCILRQDDINIYFLLTDAGNPKGGFNTLRPLTISNSTGHTYLADGTLRVYHPTYTNSVSNFNGYVDVIGTTINVIPRTTTAYGLSTSISLTSSGSGDGSGTYLQMGVSGGGGFTNNTPYINVTVANNPGIGFLSFRTDNVERMRLSNGGNLGIGVTNPTYRLQTSGGNIQFTLPTNVDSNWRNFTLEGTSLWGDGLTTASSEYGGVLYATLRQVMLQAPHIVSATGAGQNAYIRYGRAGGVSGGTWWETGCRTTGTFNISKEGSATVGMFVTQGGNVGVGIETPSYKLDVIGDIRAGSDSNTMVVLSNKELKFMGSGTAHYSIFNESSKLTIRNTSGGAAVGTAGTTLVTVDTAGNVGIGTTAPSSLLHVVGTSRLTGSSVIGAGNGNARSAGGLTVSTNVATVFARHDQGDANRGLVIINENATSGSFASLTFRTGPLSAIDNYMDMRYVSTGTGANSRLAFMMNAASTEHFTFLSNGNMGISRVDPAYHLDVGGNINMTGAYYCNGFAVIDGSRNFTGGGVTCTGVSVSAGGSISVSGGQVTSAYVGITRTEVGTHTNASFFTTSDGKALMIYNNLAGGHYNGLVQTNDRAIIFTNGTVDTGGLVIGPHSNNANGIRISNTGNVSICTTTGTERLNVGGNITATGNVNASNVSATNMYASTVQLTSGLNLVGGNDGAFFRLVQVGDLDNFRLEIGSTDNTNEPILFYQTAAERMRIHSNGFIGINDTAPSEWLSVGGNIKATGSVSCASLSVTGTLSAATFSGTFSGALNPGTGYWHNSTDNIPRLYFAANARSYYRSNDGHEWRSSGDAMLAILDNSGNFIATGEVRSQTPNGFRVTYGGYGTILRNDGANFYFLISTLSGGNGDFNSLRPMYFNLTSGHVTFGHNIIVSGTITGNGSLITSLNASQLLSGTVPSDRLTAASTAVAGIVQLNDTTSSTSTTQAATANAVRVTYNYADTKLPITNPSVTGNLTLSGPDIILNAPARRNPAVGGLRRALVHGDGDVLVMNFAGDYPGGTSIQSALQVVGGISAGSLNAGAGAIETTGHLHCGFMTFVNKSTSTSGISNAETAMIRYDTNYNASGRDMMVIEKLDANTTPGDGGIVLAQRGNDGVSTPVLTVRNARVGINSYNPQATLDVGGALRVGGGAAVAETGHTPLEGALTYTYMVFGTNGTTNDAAYLRQIGGFDGMVMALDFVDDGTEQFLIRNINSVATPDTIVTALGVGSGCVACGTTPNASYRLWVEGATYLNGTTYVAGNLGVGIVAAEKLHVSGNILATGDITAFSDRRFKKDLQPITDALQKVQSLTGYTYKKVGLEDINEERTYAGLVAQEVEEVLPEVVHTHSDGVKSLSYGNMAGLFVEAIKDMTIDMQELRDENRLLREELQSVRTQMAACLAKWNASV